MSEKIDRRKLLAGAGLGGALLLLQTGGCSSNGSGAVAKGKPKYVMVFDQNKCVGCGDCKDACTKVNELPKGQSRLALQFTCGTDGTAQCPKEDAPRGYAYDRRYVRVSCQQCQDAPCVKVCPTGAAHRDPETGIVTMNPDKCIGCKYCMAACPYGVRIQIEKTDVIEKCRFCWYEGEPGNPPACVGTCISGVRVFGDLDDPDSDISREIARTNAQPIAGDLTESKIYYVR